MSISKAKVIDTLSNEILFECDITDLDQAYEYASSMDKMGLDVKVVAATITETLCDSLGIELDKRADYEQSVASEIDDHDGSCCATPAVMTSSNTLQ